MHLELVLKLTFDVLFFLYCFFRTVNSEGFKPNLETQLVPLLATKQDETSAESKDKSVSPSSNKDAHHPLLMQVLFARISRNIHRLL